MSDLLNRRTFVRNLTVTGLGLLASACASPAAAPTAAPTAAPKAAAPTTAAAPAAAAAPTTSAAAPAWTLPTSDITVTFWHGTDVTATKLYMETFIPGYQKLHPNITIEAQSTPGIDQKLLVALSTETAPDMFIANAGTIQTFMAKQALALVPSEAWEQPTIDAMLSKYFLPNVMTPLMMDGKLYGIPNQMNASSLMINTRLFKEANLDPIKDAPKTWDDMVKLNQLLTKKDSAGRIVQKGFEFQWARDDQTSSALQMLIRQAGGEVLEDGTKPIFNSEAGVMAMKTFKAVSVDPRVTQNTPASPVQDFATEQNVMHSMGPNGGTFAEAINPKIKGNYIFGPLPQIYVDRPSSTFSVFSMVVNTKASDDKKKVAHDFIRYMGSQPEVWLDQTGQLTPMLSLTTSPTAKQIMPFLDVALNDLKVAKPPTRTDFADQLNKALRAACERVVLENQDPKAAMDQAAADFSRSIL